MPFGIMNCLWERRGYINMILSPQESGAALRRAPCLNPYMEKLF